MSDRTSYSSRTRRCRGHRGRSVWSMPSRLAALATMRMKMPHLQGQRRHLPLQRARRARRRTVRLRRAQTTRQRQPRPPATQSVVEPCTVKTLTSQSMVEQPQSTVESRAVKTPAGPKTPATQSTVESRAVKTPAALKTPALGNVLIVKSGAGNRASSPIELTSSDDEQQQPGTHEQPGAQVCRQVAYGRRVFADWMTGARQEFCARAI